MTSEPTPRRSDTFFRGPIWDKFHPDDKEYMLNEDLSASSQVLFVLFSIICMGLLIGLTGVLLSMFGRR